MNRVEQPRIGILPHGPRNRLTDVPGVLVGHCTLDDGAVQTGVTAILPHGGNLFADKLVAACHVINGFGKAAGLVQVGELGQLETPIILTNTLAVGTAFTALVRRALAQNPAIGRETSTVNPLVLECNDGWLNDIRGLHVQEQHVFAAIDQAAADFPLGAVGAGRGMRCHGLKGGIGSASRVVEIGAKPYTLGALVLSNHGHLQDLTTAGKHIGPQLAERLRAKEQAEQGSVIVVLGTDVPLSASQLRRLCHHAVAGLCRSGANIGNGSGEMVVAFTTANRVRHEAPEAFRTVTELNEAHIDLLFRAVAEATEEAVLSSLYQATTVTGRDGHTAWALGDLLNERGESL